MVTSDEKFYIKIHRKSFLKMTEKTLSEISGQFDAFIFDAYGVFWSGKDFFQGSRETMQKLVEEGKEVCVLSNATQLPAKAEESYAKRGLIKGVHYHNLYTSGGFTREVLEKGELPEVDGKELKKYYTFGTPNKDLFKDTKYEEVNSPEKADFVYFSIASLSEEEIKKFPEHKDDFRLSKFSGDTKMYDCTVVDPFIPYLEKFKALGLPVLNANPDHTAMEKAADRDKPEMVVRQGLLGQKYREMGGQVFEYGKPYKAIYSKVLRDLHDKGISVAAADRHKIAMIGDSVFSDIKGAQNAKITPCLCTKTGVTAERLKEGRTIESLCKESGVDMKKIILISSVGPMNAPEKAVSKTNIAAAKKQASGR